MTTRSHSRLDLPPNSYRTPKERVFLTPSIDVLRNSQLLDLSNNTSTNNGVLVNLQPPDGCNSERAFQTMYRLTGDLPKSLRAVREKISMSILNKWLQGLQICGNVTMSSFKSVRTGAATFLIGATSLRLSDSAWAAEASKI